ARTSLATDRLKRPYLAWQKGRAQPTKKSRLSQGRSDSAVPPWLDTATAVSLSVAITGEPRTRLSTHLQAVHPANLPGDLPGCCLNRAFSHNAVSLTGAPRYSSGATSFNYALRVYPCVPRLASLRRT